MPSLFSVIPSEAEESHYFIHCSFCGNLILMKIYYVYIITNKWNTTLYIGVTNNLARRMYEHKQGLVKGFSNKYNLCKLLYFEETNDVRAAIEREKQLKKWRRDKKVSLIKKKNPQFEDLSKDLFG